MAKKVRDIVIDADHILFLVTESTADKFKDNVDEEHDDFGVVPEFSLKPYKEHFKSIIEEYVKIVEVESIFYKWEIGKVRVILSDKRNFRYDIYPEYKSKRPPTPELRKKLKKWAMKKYKFVPNCEADEVVAYYVREKGAIGFTTDKDLLYGGEGRWFDCYHSHRCWVETTEEDSYKFMLKQCVAGDATDGIVGVKGIGLKTAEKLLDENGYSWNSVVNIYKSRGLTEDDAVLTRNLVDMTIWNPKDGVTLWEKKSIRNSERR